MVTVSSKVGSRRFLFLGFRPSFNPVGCLHSVQCVLGFHSVVDDKKVLEKVILEKIFVDDGDGVVG